MQISGLQAVKKSSNAAENCEKFQNLMNSGNAKIPILTTITVELGFLWHFVLLLLKTCSLDH